MKKLVAFDIDGTLIQGSIANDDAFIKAFLKVYGIEAHIDMVERHGMTDLQITTEVLKLFDLTPGSKIEEFFKVKKEEYILLSKKEVLVPLPGVKGILEDLQAQHIPCGLVTGNEKSVALLKMEEAGLLSYFDVAASAFGHTTAVRSDLVEAIKKQGWSPIFLVGDTPRDIEAGKKANVTTIGVGTGAYSVQQLTEAGADLALQDLTDSSELLKFIE